ncbi:MAG: type 3 dihydrofolate reductase [Candidatus Promineifilaceae bacterium]
MTAKLSFIVAMDKNGVIGAGGRIPWHLPDDLKWFRKHTVGKPVIMGRKTYESLPPQFRPLPDRHNIVVTRNLLYEVEGATVVHDFDEALEAAGDVPEVIVGGGGDLYAQLLPRADRIYLTLVDTAVSGDAYFPSLNMAEWQETFREHHPADEHHPYPFDLVILDKK